MIRAMYSGLAGMRNHQVRMDVIGNNISNINTTGFKGSRANFKDTLYQAMGVNNACQVGTGLTVSGVSDNFAQGEIRATGKSLDLAISGNGFFGVQDETGRIKYTRDGSFYLDKDYKLVHTSGLKLLDSGENEITVELEPGQSTENIYVTEKGEVYIRTEEPGDEDILVAEIGLYNFKNINGLTKVGDNLYLDNSASGEPIQGLPQEEGFGFIRAGFLERSNVDMAEEMANLIITQRAYQANARVFTAADEVLQESIELKR